MVSLIQILYSLNDNESSLSFDPSNKLKVFKNIVNLTQKVNVDHFDIYYNDKIINAMDEMEVKRIIGHDTNPYFLIIKKNASPQERANYKLRLSQVKKKENKFKFKVLIQNYPSRTEMNTLINSFLDINFIHDNFFIDNTQNGISVMFGVKVTKDNFRITQRT
jgi:hypothetical protein